MKNCLLLAMLIEEHGGSLMMTKSQWISNALEAVKCIASFDYQSRAWVLSEIDYPCHFEELISKLYDDGDLSNLIDNYAVKFDLSGEQRKILTLLRDSIDRYCERSDIYVEGVDYKKIKERKVFNDPEWKAIQVIAQDTLKAFQAPPIP